jgi:aspartyl-tRNA(Asn)/glutamyl-tRNA(Gln) amidotransferase subunit A
MIAYASSLDQGGTLTKTAEDSAMMLNLMAGFDERDSTSMDLPVPDYTATLNNILVRAWIRMWRKLFRQR